jgi:hypothetical protein
MLPSRPNAFGNHRLITHLHRPLLPPNPYEDPSEELHRLAFPAFAGETICHLPIDA